jgi:ArsR family transcriptional regulator
MSKQNAKPHRGEDPKSQESVEKRKPRLRSQCRRHEIILAGFLTLLIVQLRYTIRKMTLARTEDFPDKDTQLSTWCKALAHPARIAILRTLAKRKECMCGELVFDLPLAQSTVSQHLKALKEAGLVKGEIDGPRSRYCINDRNFKKLIAYFGSFSDSISASENC